MADTTQKRILTSKELMPGLLQALEEGGQFLLTVTGDSMRPTLRPERDAVALAAPKAYRRGDIVLFRRDSGEYILHRIVGVRGDRLTMNGDAQTWTEEIAGKQVIAVVRQICRDGRRYNCQGVFGRLYGRGAAALRPARRWLFRLREMCRRGK